MRADRHSPLTTGSRGAPPLMLMERFTLVTFLGEGTVGRTYLANDAVRRQQVIIKLVHRDIVADAGALDVLRPQLNALAALSHPRIGRLFDFGPWEGGLFLVLEKLEGETLRSRLDAHRERPLPPAAVSRLMQQVAQTLEAIGPHAPHGGLKPENVWIAPDDHLRIADYGLNLLVSPDKLRSSAALLNTATFLAPEIYTTAVKGSPAADAFALGMIWKECLPSLPASPSTKASRDGATLTVAHRLIAQLTRPETRERQEALKELAQKEGRSSPSASRSHWRSAVLALSMLLLLVGAAEWLRRSLFNSGTHGHADATPWLNPAELYREAKHLQQARHQWFKDLVTLPELAGPLWDTFDDQPILDSLWELQQAQAHPPSRFAEADQGIHQRFLRESERLRLGKALTAHWRADRAQGPNLAFLESLADDTSSYRRESAWEEKRQAILRAVANGELRQAVTEAENLLIEGSETIASAWQAHFEQADSAQKAWKSVLAAHQLAYLEPCQDLSSRLHAYTPNEIPEELAQAFHDLNATTLTFTQWTSDLEALPPTPEATWVNSLGMRFRKCGPLMASIWETRVLDFAGFVESTGIDMRRLWRSQATDKTPTHPVVSVSRMDAEDFCLWLTERERERGMIAAHQVYRLPTDLEWSHLAGLEEPDDGRSPSERGWEFPDHFPWDPSLPESARGNYFTPEPANADNQFQHKDPYHETAPVGQFAPNALGLYDLGGNVWEWVRHHDRNQGEGIRLLETARGGGWRTVGRDQQRTEHRLATFTDHPEIGFRVVLASVEMETSRRSHIDTE